MKIELEITEDGSHTLFVPSLNEHYHSINGAIQEARHVFIDAGLNQCEKNQINILEVGFGTGLNTFLTILETQTRDIRINYTTTELFPVPSSLVEKLNFPSKIDTQTTTLFHQIHSIEWEKRKQITPNFSLLKLKIDLTRQPVQSDLDSYDIIYFDAFGPDKQPEMWNASIFKNLYNLCSNKGILVTYSAKGSVRRALKSIGFEVERIQGPPGKREMIRAVK